MICRTGQICIVQSPTMHFSFFTISNLNYTVFVSLALYICMHSFLLRKSARVCVCVMCVRTCVRVSVLPCACVCVRS